MRWRQFMGVWAALPSLGVYTYWWRPERTFSPEKLRIKRYKFWMRSVLVVWWTVLLLGMTTYTRWYVTLR
jgi:hypothetical protein